MNVDQKEDDVADDKLAKATGINKLKIKTSIAYLMQSATDLNNIIHMSSKDVGLLLSVNSDHALLLVKGQIVKSSSNDQMFTTTT